MEPKKSENDLQWENLVKNLTRPLQLCDLDFTDLSLEDEKDILAPRGAGNGIPPPPPLLANVAKNQNTSRAALGLGQFAGLSNGSTSDAFSQSNADDKRTQMGSGSNDGSIKPPPPLFGIFNNNQNLNKNFNQNSTTSNVERNNSPFNTIKKNKKTVFFKSK